MKTMQEGKAVFYASVAKIVSTAMDVFYNPIMRLNRDLSVLLMGALEKESVRVGLPLAGSGVRGFRMLKELPAKMVEKVSMNDCSEKAVKAMQRGAKANRVKSRVKVTREEANQFMLFSKGFDYIDIDPYGSPLGFLDAAFARISRNGLLGVTATDTACLCGSSPKACVRKYGAKPLRNSFMHETGLRILMGKVMRVGAGRDRAAVPFFSYYRDHYFRIMFQVVKGKKKVDALLGQLGFVVWCPSCLRQETKQKPFLEMACECGGTKEFAGPLYLGGLHDKDMMKKMVNVLDQHDVSKETMVFLDHLMNESALQVPFFYDLHEFARRKLVKEIPQTDKVLEVCRQQKTQAVRSHIAGHGVKIGSYDALVKAAKKAV